MKAYEITWDGKKWSVILPPLGFADSAVVYTGTFEECEKEVREWMILASQVSTLQSVYPQE